MAYLGVFLAGMYFWYVVYVVNVVYVVYVMLNDAFVCALPICDGCAWH